MNSAALPPIPAANPDLDARDYHAIPIDTADPRGSEPLVDIAKSGIAVLPFYNVADGSNAPYGHRIDGSLSQMWCRQSLLAMLLSANKTLATFKCELVVYDAYRPIATQNGIWAWALDKTKTEYPDLSVPQVEALTSQYSSDPRRFDPADATTWPTHATGASVDVMLRSLETGETLDMGAAFDDLSPVAQTDYLEQQLGRNLISRDDAALIHRRILYWAMIGAGFANYSGEYWHFDFGNQMYVLSTSAQTAPVDRAWYGYCAAPD